MSDENYDRTELTKDQAFKFLYPKMIKYFSIHIDGCYQDFEDFAMDVMVDLINNKWNELETHTLAGLKVWVQRAGYFKVLDFIKKRKTQPLPTSIEDAMQNDPEFERENFSTPPPEIIEPDEKSLLESIHELLTPQDFKHFVMRADGVSPPNVAKELQISDGTERTRYCRIRQQLQIALQKRRK